MFAEQPQPVDHARMRDAIRLAARTPRRPWPNPPVGALVVRDDGVVVGRGAHHGPGTPHAEIAALDEAGAAARGATLYTTLEPCNHFGRTPPCAPRVAHSGIRRLVVGVRDPNPSVSGGGLDVARAAGLEVVLGAAGDEALELAWPFVVTRAFERPYVLLKTATSVDARFAPARDTGLTGPVYLTGLEARRSVHCLRRWSDLVLVGSRTVLVDRPMLDARLAGGEADCPAANPMPGYVDTDFSVDAAWPGRGYLVFGGRDSAPPARLAAVRASNGTPVLCETRNGRVVPESLLAHLAECGVHTVLLEGGPTLAHSFLAAGLVDRWVSFVAPVVLGTGPTWPTAAAGDLVAHSRGAGPADSPSLGAESMTRLALTRVDRVGADARLVFDRLSFAETLRDLAGPRAQAPAEARAAGTGSTGH